MERERVSWSLPENDPDVFRVTQKNRQDSTWSSRFGHIGSTVNGSFNREWTVSEFRQSIDLLRNPETDLDAFYRTILRDPDTCRQFSEQYSFDPKEFWQNHNNSDLPKEEACDYEMYLQKFYPADLAIEVERESSISNYSDKQLLEFLKVYNEQIQHIKEEAIEKINSKKEAFLSNFKQFAEKNDIHFDEDVIKHRFDTLEYNFFDIYNYSDRSGDYSDITHTVRVQLNEYGNFSTSTLQHEYLHGISGKEFIVSLSRSKNDDKYHDSKHAKRVGLEIDRTPTEGDSFAWLNEAVTEHINIALQEDKGEDKYIRIFASYPDERELFDLILESGSKPIDPKYFYQAYFEGDTGDKKDLVQRKKLYEVISESYGSPIFLVKLDDLVGKFGIKKAIEVFQDSGKTGIEELWKETFVEESGVLVGGE